MIVTDLPPQNHVVVTEQMPQAIGDAGRILWDEWNKARVHWESQISFGRMDLEKKTTEVFEQIPFVAEFTVDVTYKFVGDIAPLPYNWDE